MLLVEMVAVTGKQIGQLVNELYSEYGSPYNEERDYSFSQEKKNLIINQLFDKEEVSVFDLEINRVSYMDGIKIYFKNNAWISARFSGTEPLLRIFAESGQLDETIALIKVMETFLDL